MEAARSKNVVLEHDKQRIEIPLDFEGGKYVSMIYVNGVPCHFEAIPVERFDAECRIDDDPDYQPQADREGHSFLLVPFSR